MRFATAFAVFVTLLTACADRNAKSTAGASETDAFLDTLQARTFDWFWDETDPLTGLTAARAPSWPFSSIAAIGFAVTANGIGVQRGWISRGEARERTLATLRFLWQAPQGPDSSGVSGYRGFFYHFLDLETGHRFRTVELSTIDSALLLGGVLFAQVYFDGDHPDEAAIRALADSIYRRVDWPFFLQEPPFITMGWRPERGYGPGRWRGYDESILLHILALGSPTHPLEKETYDAYVSTYNWAEFYGQAYVNFPPLFGYHFSHIWIDFRGIQDDYTRERGIDYFENTRRATLAQRAYAIENPNDWAGYGPNVWGLSASTGPGSFTLALDGRERRFFGYRARGVAEQRIVDDGTLCPAAATGSIPFAPEIALEAVATFRELYGDHVFGRYGFFDAFNPTLKSAEGVQLQHGSIVPGVGWFATDYLSTNQGPIVTMIENYRSGLIWEVMKRSPYVVRGLCRAGFRGGWLEGSCED